MNNLYASAHFILSAECQASVGNDNLDLLSIKDEERLVYVIAYIARMQAAHTILKQNY